MDWASVRTANKMSVKSGLRRTLVGPKKVLRFTMPHNSRLKEVLQEYLSGINVKEYEKLVCSIRDDVFQPEELLELLQQCAQCVSLLDRDLRLIVEAILSVKWAHMDEHIVREFRSFIVNLLCAHNYHTKYAIDKLVENFLESDGEWQCGAPTDEECTKYANVHSVLNVLFKVIPMCRDILLQSLTANYPYMKKPPEVHEAFVHNMLWILDYQVDLRADIFHLLFSRLIVLDSNAPKEEILSKQDAESDFFEFEADGRTGHPIGHVLDVCLDRLLNYIITECYEIESGILNWDKTKNLYQELIKIFDKVILPTYNIHHVQFVVFFVCSFKSSLSEAFLGFLWSKVTNISVATIHRQTAVSYVASFVARGKFVSLNMLKSSLQLMSTWIHKYISSQDGLESIKSDLRAHSVFYSVCQSLFYVIAFRHRDLVNSRTSIAFLETLNLGKIVTCRLNPLRVCQPAILQNFAAVTRTYQLAYCYSIIEHNQRNVMPTVYVDEKGSHVVKSAILDAFFPFDPFLIKRCGSKLDPIYLEYKGFDETSVDVENKMEEDDDFLNDSTNKIFVTSPSAKIFSYGTSPGFKYKT